MKEPHHTEHVTPEQFRRIRQVFEAALERAPADRPAFVEQACGGDTLLIAEVDRMLAAEDRSDAWLDRLPVAEARLRRCPSCHAELAAADRFCRRCGASAAPDSDVDEGRFRPGTLFARRFRIVGLLGRGGMGDVYRANDLELGQPVALKFLPTARFDERARARLRQEVRVARQVSHPHVCRVYDIGEAEGHLFLSMEYIDGEDLGGLLRRIGRLPADKVVEFARKLCGGLAAAHAKGVLHRDLKPGNIMVDARGEICITDFGLAAAADRIAATEVRHGTPAYMAPEQLAGRDVTVQSDLYALGLVLYEMVTGKPPFRADTPAEFQRLREDHALTQPSRLVPDLDPAVERVILRCLDPDPKQRPPSALAVAAALPGGDPLAEALAAGQTPSPDMVAVAGSTEALRPAVAWSLLAGIAVSLVILCVLTPKAQIISRVPLEYPPEVLAAKARGIVRDLGYTERPVDSAFGFHNEEEYAEYLQTQISAPTAWDQRLSSSPFPVSFWYRQSPVPLVPLVPGGFPDSLARVGPDDPDPNAPGMLSVGLDVAGRLIRFVAIPPLETSSDSPDAETRAPDWSVPLRAAGLSLEQLTPAEPQAKSVTMADLRAAWTGVYSSSPDLPIRVEGTSFRGRVVSFELIWPWTTPDRTAVDSPYQPKPIERVLFLVALTVAVLTARYNWKRDRGDLRGAWRLGLVMSLVALVRRILGWHYASGALALRLLFDEAPNILFWGGFTATLYLAMEPWLRRHWPKALITWSRILVGRWRDPLVGRDILVGVLFSTGLAVLWQGARVALVHQGEAPMMPDSGGSFGMDNLLGLRSVAYRTVWAFLPVTGVGLFFMFFLLLRLMRKRWLAVCGLVALTTLAWAPAPSIQLSKLEFWVLVAYYVCRSLGEALIMLRFGLLVIPVTDFVRRISNYMVHTTDFAAWYGQSSLVGVLVISALALWGFRAALGQRPLSTQRAFSDHVRDDCS